jgi:hypothetical protein
MSSEDKTPNNNDQPNNSDQLSERERLELEREITANRKEVARIIADTERERAQRLATEQEQRDLKRNQMVSAEFQYAAQAGAKFYADNNTMLGQLQGVEYAADGNVYATSCATGQRVSLGQAIIDYAIANPTLADKRSLPRLIAAQQPEVLAKEDFKTRQEKVKFINENGLEAWDAMPLHRRFQGEPQSFEQYKSLPFDAKRKIQDRLGHEAFEQWLGQLPRAGKKF